MVDIATAPINTGKIDTVMVCTPACPDMPEIVMGDWRMA